MTEPFRLRVLQALTAVLQGISPANGYTHDMSVSVFRGRTAFGDGDPIPMGSILEDPRNFEPELGSESTTVSTGDWKLVIQGFLADDPANPTDPAYRLLAEFKKALIKERVRAFNANDGLFGLGTKKPMVEKMLIGSGVVRPADDVSSKAYFWLPLTLYLVEDLENPFT